MAKVKVVTDSTAYLPHELIERYGIRIVPLKVLFGTESYDEGVDITNDEFYRRLAEAKTLPTTSQPSVNDFIQAYTELAQGGHPILSIHISSKISGTVNSALTAKSEFPEAQIEIVDSLFTSMGLGMIALDAARAADEGQPLLEIKASAEKLIQSMNLIFVVDTLEYLQKGGRIGAASALLGTLLRIKPILHLKDGLIQPIAKVRTKHKAMEHLLELVEERVRGGTSVRVTVIHAQAAEEALALGEEVRGRFNCVEMYFSELGPVIGAHVGPGTLGLAFYSE